MKFLCIAVLALLGLAFVGEQKENQAEAARRLRGRNNNVTVNVVSGAAVVRGCGCR